ncbi:unnamed protein product, partial [marine sediment metagenome]
MTNIPNKNQPVKPDSDGQSQEKKFTAEFRKKPESVIKAQRWWSRLEI